MPNVPNSYQREIDGHARAGVGLSILHDYFMC